MTSTIPAVMDPTWWTAMSSCGPARLAATPDGWRLGLGVLQQRGVAAWLRLRQATVPTVSPPTPARAASPVAGGCGGRAGRAAGLDGAGRRRRR